MAVHRSTFARRLLAFGAAASISAFGLAASPLVGGHAAVVRATSSCDLQSAGDNIQHVIYIQFDNHPLPA